MQKSTIKKTFDIKTITKIGLLGAISFVLMYFDIPLWFAPSFYKIDFSEVAVLMGAFALGPVPGVMIELIKIVLYLLLKGSSTGGIGDISNFIIGCAFVVPAAMVYRRHKSFRSALWGMGAGTACMTVLGSLLNAFVLLPVYAKAFGWPLQNLIDMGTALNGNITGLGTFVLFAVVPFNLLKGVLVSLLTILLYKKASGILHR
ncbi:MAG: ECF transporter S component [Oscillospiraceae bacterium]